MRTEPSDRELLATLRADPAAFELFYRRHVDRVVGYAARRLREPADVADLVAATFVTVLTAAPSYDPDRGEPSAWLLGIAAHLIAGRSRRSRRDAALLAKIAGRRLLDPDDIERLEARIDAEGLTPAEAAEVLGISAANFRMRLSAARRALDNSLKAGRDDRRPDPASSMRSARYQTEVRA